jgi:predicted nucleic acid-binding protein
VAEQAAVNASPVILLARVGAIDLLRLIADTLIVPRSVADEVLDPPGAQVLATTPWLKIVADPNVSPQVRAWDLGAGETAVISWGLACPGNEVVIDDLAARRCAAVMQVPVRGTLGLVLLGKRRGALPAARPMVRRLIDAGMYLSDRTAEAALRLVGE